jgi:hypothetical protein
MVNKRKTDIYINFNKIKLINKEITGIDKRA